MKLITKSAIVLLALITPFSTGIAKEIKVGGTHSRNEIQKKCDKAGGVFYSQSKKGGGGFGCNNVDKGTGIMCQANGKCTGIVPD